MCAHVVEEDSVLTDDASEWELRRKGRLDLKMKSTCNLKSPSVRVCNLHFEAILTEGHTQMDFPLSLSLSFLPFLKVASSFFLAKCNHSWLPQFRHNQYVARNLGLNSGSPYSFLSRTNRGS